MTESVSAAVESTLWRFEPGAWLFVRTVLAIEWLRGGWSKVGDAGWTAPPVGAAVEGFLNGAIAKSTAGEHPEVPHWFHRLAEDVFLPNADLFAYLVSYGELLIGLALAVGLFTRLAALAGITMNLAFLWAGTTSTNPPLLLLGLGLVFFGHRASRLGIDGWLMPRVARAVPASLRQFGTEALFVGALITGAWLALVATTGLTWVTVALAALAVTLVAGRAGLLDSREAAR